jgi:hypothetical protein
MKLRVSVAFSPAVLSAVLLSGTINDLKASANSADAHISGRVRFEPDPLDITKLHVPLEIYVWSTDSDRLRKQIDAGIAKDSLPAPVPVAADGTFSIDGLAPGRYHLRTTPVPAGWWLRSAVLEGRDALDVGFEIHADGQVGSELLVTFSDKHAELTGVVSSPNPDRYAVVLYPTDKAIWDVAADRAVWHDAPRRIRTAAVNSDGRFNVHDPVPGDYFVSAVSAFKASDLVDRSFFQRLSSESKRVTIDDGQRQTVNVSPAAR